MKILFIIDTLETGGAEKSLLDITSKFSFFEPVFIQLFPGGELTERFEKAGIKVFSYNFSVKYNFKKIAQSISSDVQKIDPVIIHSTLFRSDMVARELAQQFQVPLINSFVNNSYSNNRYESLNLSGKIKLKGIELWDRYTSKKVDLFISNSETIKITNSKALKVPLEKVRVIYRGRDHTKFESIDDSRIEELKKEFGILNEKIFLNVSRLLERKGQLDLIKAFQKVLKVYPESKLLIAGEGSFREHIENEIEACKMSKSISLLGNRNDIPDLLKLADYFVFPSHFEGLPGALIEAMFAKTLIISSNIPENLECVNENKAYLYPVGDIHALTQTMIKALENPCLEFREEAYNYAYQNFQIHKIARKYEDTYRHLLALN